MSLPARPRRTRFVGLAVALVATSIAVAAPSVVASATSYRDRVPLVSSTPGAVTALLATPSTTGAVVSWTLPAPVSGMTTTFTVTSSPGNVQCVTTSSSCAVTGLASGTTYTFTVVPSDAAGSGPSTGPSDAIQVNGWTDLQTITSVFTNSLGQYSSGGLTFNGISCWANGQCAGAGSYLDANDVAQAFIDVETNGVWGQATEIPGSSALNVDGTYPNQGASVNSITCPFANNCVVGGSYMDANGVQQAFVEMDIDGHWDAMQEVPGTAALNLGATTASGGGFVTSVSCLSSAACFAVGGYVSTTGQFESFVSDESADKWSSAVEIPGTSTLNVGATRSNVGSLATSVSCPKTGSCETGGYYTDASGVSQAFVDSETSGTWASATPLIGVAVLNAGGLASNNGAQVNFINCPATGRCVAGGYYVDDNHDQQAFVAEQSAGAWSSVTAPGVAALNVGALSTNVGAQVSKVACATATSCVAVGTYLDSSQTSHIFITSLSGTSWQNATVLQVGGVTGGGAVPVAISCSSVGSCAVAGVITPTSSTTAAGVAQEVNGQWGLFESIGSVQSADTLNAGEATALSCSADGGCAIVGYFDDGYLVGTYSSTLATPPLAPGGVRVASATVAGHVIVNWRAPSFDGGSAVTGYTASASPGGASCTTISLKCTISGLSPSSAYRITVVARSADGAGPSSPLTTPALYPRSSSRVKLVVISKSAKVGAVISVLVLGVKANQAVAVTLAKGTTGGCNTGPWRQCLVSIKSHARGTLRVTLDEGRTVLTTRLIKVT